MDKMRTRAGRAHLALIRPDGHVAWVGPLGDLGGLVAFMDRWYRRARAGDDQPAITTRRGRDVT